MKVLLDTDICIYVINRRDPKPLERLRAYAIGDVGISAISYAELRFGIENSTRPVENLERLERFLLPLEILPFDAEAARVYGKVRTQLKQAGSPIGNNDLLIASHALSLEVAIATNNSREFSRVKNLRIEVWA